MPEPYPITSVAARKTAPNRNLQAYKFAFKIKTMKPLITLLISTFFCLAQTTEKPAVFVGKNAFFDAKIEKKGPFSVKISHKDGVFNAFAWELSEKDQKALGFDPKATVAEKLRIELDSAKNLSQKASEKALHELNQKEKARKEEEERAQAIAENIAKFQKQAEQAEVQKKKTIEEENQALLQMMYENFPESEVVYSPELKKYFSNSKAMRYEILIKRLQK
jgi:hypothetical protein